MRVVGVTSATAAVKAFATFFFGGFAPPLSIVVLCSRRVRGIVPSGSAGRVEAVARDVTGLEGEEALLLVVRP